MHDIILKRRALPVLSLLAVLAFQAQAASGWAWTGKVVKVQDGDTVTVLARNNKQVKIRLYGVDAPEKKQAYGSRATEALRELAALKTVEVDVQATDNYGRSVALVTVRGRRESLSEAMARAGLAWVYDDYCRQDQCEEWRRAQDEARRQRLGLWAERDPTPPWQWRKDRKGREDDGFWDSVLRLLR